MKINFEGFKKMSRSQLKGVLGGGPGCYYLQTALCTVHVG